MNPQLLRLKDAPFLLTVLTGLCAWGITHAVDRLQQTPIIEYRLSEYRTNGVQRVRCQIENLCADRVFTKITFSLGGPKQTNEAYSDAWSDVIAPAHTPREMIATNKAVSREFLEFHPGWRLTLDAARRGDFTPYVQFDTGDGSGEIKGVRLLPHGPQTILVRQELKILAALIFIAVVLACLYLHWLNRAVGGGRTKSAEAPANPK